MKVLIFWDVYWKIGRAALKKQLPLLRSKYNPDFIIVNVDNISSWRGPIEKHIIEMEKLWIDIMTWGDHIFDNLIRIKDKLEEKNSKLLRPANFYESKNYKVPGKWYKVIEKNGKKLLLIHLLWEVFMKFRVENPFIKVENILKEFKKERLDWIIIDFHKEVTSEWYWMVYFLNGKVSFIYWTHTHIQTNDDIILDNWTWIISDIWMVWSIKWVIGADYNSVEKMFLTWINKWKIEQSLDKNYIVNWVYLEIWEDSKSKKIEKIRISWVL
jgi:hypothetical protein